MATVRWTARSQSCEAHCRHKRYVATSSSYSYLNWNLSCSTVVSLLVEAGPPSPTLTVPLFSSTCSTGGGTGIGQAIAHAYAAAGAKVVVASRTLTTLENTVASIEQAGGVAAAIVCDVTDEQSVSSLVAGTVAQFGRLDIMVNNSVRRR